MDTILNYSASKIAQAERKYNTSFFDELASLSNTNPKICGLLFLFNAGGGSDEEFDNIMKNGGVEKIFLKILEGLKNGGFLTEEALEAGKNAMEQAMKNIQAPTQNSGEEIKE